MLRKDKRTIVSSAIGLMLAAAPLQAAVIVDGQLDPVYGLPRVVQINTTNASGQLDPGAGNGGLTPATSGGVYTQFTAAYGVIDVPNNKFNLFFAGSIFLNNTMLNLAIDANPSTGVSKLNESTVPSLPGDMNKVSFDAGFAPETMFSLEFEGGRVPTYRNLLTGAFDQYGGYSVDEDPIVTPGVPAVRTGAAGTPTLVMSGDNSAGASIIQPADFTSITTGLEFAFDLDEIGYIAGNPINASLFITHGSGKGMTNVVLGGFAYQGDPSNLDYYYIDDHVGAAPDRQFFNSTLYPGDQFFTVGVPEPTSLSLIGLAAIPMMRRRRKTT